MSIWIILLSVGGAVGVLCSIALGVAFVRARRLAKAPPPPPAKCPSCGSAEIEVLESGFWDGINTGGGFQFGICKHCGTRGEHRSAWDSQSRQMRYLDRLVTEEEWQEEHVQPALRRQQLPGGDVTT